jgi:3-dehydroquinate synthase class II
MTIEHRLCDIEIEEMKGIGRCDNVCLTFSSFKRGHCILAGPYNRALFMVPLASKVNAGPVSMYVLCKDKKTKYLSKGELKQGDKLLTMDSMGNESSAIFEKNEIEIMPMVYIAEKHRISGNDIFSLIDSNKKDYFNIYREIFHLKERKTEKSVHVLDINKYKNKKKDICAYLDVATIVPDLNVKYKVGDKIMAYIQMPGLSSRHFGINYGGDNASCIER